MKSIIRYTGTIAVTAVIAGAIAVYVFDAPSAAAQSAPPPAPADTQSGVPAPPVKQPDKGVAAGVPGSTDSGASAGSANGTASGSAVPAAGAGSAESGSAAPTAAGSAAGSAAPAAPSKPSIAETSCENVLPEKTITGVADAEVAAGSVVRFQLPAGVDIIPDSQTGAGLEVTAGQTKCLRFQNEGVFTFHSRTKQHGAITVRQWYDILVNKEVEDLKGGNFWMPKSVNAAASDSDLMYYAVLGLSLFFFFAIAITVVYLVVKYRHRPGHKAMPSAAHHDALEITWTVIPTIITVFLFYYGWRTYIKVVTPPTKAVEINVLARQWTWQFTHSNGVQDSDLHVPVNTPVRLVMTSQDVLHSFYAPVMRVKQDIIPRRYTYAWFLPTKPGTYRLTCAEYCGTNHSQMGITEGGRRAVLVVHEPGGYERYLSDKAALSMNMDPKDLGKMLYEKKGCNACHTIDGSTRVGPTWASKDWAQMIPLADGSTVKMDENYIRESVMYPQAKSRPGYPASMPSFEGQLKDKELEGIIAYIKSLKQ